MGATVVFTLTETFESAGPCCNCGVAIVMPQELLNRYRGNHEWFHCVNGHRQHFPQETELEKTKKLLESERRWREQERAKREAAERQVIAAKGQITKIKNRVGNGVCPCCNRTFVNLQRHMGTKHPDFKSEEA